MASNPENLEAPNASELRPKDPPSLATIRALGATAINGSNR